MMVLRAHPAQVRYCRLCVWRRLLAYRGWVLLQPSGNFGPMPISPGFLRPCAKGWICRGLAGAEAPLARRVEDGVFGIVTAKHGLSPSCPGTAPADTPHARHEPGLSGFPARNVFAHGISRRIPIRPEIVSQRAGHAPRVPDGDSSNTPISEGGAQAPKQLQHGHFLSAGDGRAAKGRERWRRSRRSLRAYNRSK